MRRNPDDDKDPFGGGFNGIEDLLAGMTGGDEPPVDVHEYDDEIRVVAELPDVTADDMEIQCDGRTVAIYAAVKPRPVMTRVNLPSYVNEQSLHWSLNNGILEITMDHGTDPANIGFH
ncbi:hsp20 type chaperone [Halorubrum californiense DSM 19288]|uniref:Hsp20 type chaperone n=1 Tax=Halorubrum californiense DSM 19288 TaxID=1227465 RepID=M0E0X1_9EURY|nr:Hsp20/alpha crystallin family protein [Halorubrum californiense]ELZ40688.1 hsp20 type chaperone [Halorubrum californiense DSM 19288]